MGSCLWLESYQYWKQRDGIQSVISVYWSSQEFKLRTPWLENIKPKPCSWQPSFSLGLRESMNQNNWDHNEFWSRFCLLCDRRGGCKPLGKGSPGAGEGMCDKWSGYLHRSRYHSLTYLYFTWKHRIFTRKSIVGVVSKSVHFTRFIMQCNV